MVAWGVQGPGLQSGQGEAMGVLAAATPKPVGNVPGLALEFPSAPGERW